MGKDVAEALEYANTRDALNRHVDTDDKNTVVIPDGNKKGNPNQSIINESGLYSLILGSKLKKAKEFKHWVTAEVLPTIRKTHSVICHMCRISSLFYFQRTYVLITILTTLTTMPLKKPGKSRVFGC